MSSEVQGPHGGSHHTRTTSGLPEGAGVNVQGLGAGVWWRGGRGGCGQHHFWVVSSSTSPLGLLLAPVSLGAWSDLNVWGHLSHQQRPLWAPSDLIKPRVCCQLGEASCPLASSFLRACAQCGAALRISFQGSVGSQQPRNPGLCPLLATVSSRTGSRGFWSSASDALFAGCSLAVWPWLKGQPSLCFSFLTRKSESPGGMRVTESPSVP